MSNGGSAITTYTVSSNVGGFTATGGSSPITITGLSNGTAYTFTVTASNAYGTSTASSASNSITPTNVPGAPTIGTATAGNGEATVTFTAPLNDGGSTITSYTVSSNTGGFSATGGASPITVTGLTNGTTYTFTVTATNVHGTSTPSATSNSIVPATVPGAPTIGTATRGNGEATGHIHRSGEQRRIRNHDVHRLLKHRRIYRSGRFVTDHGYWSDQTVRHTHSPSPHRTSMEPAQHLAQATA